MRRTWADDPRANQDDYVVLCDGKEVGRMYKTMGVGGDTVWQWTIYGINRSGREPTLDAAKARWRTAFEAGDTASNN
jgi:hypothetical protein